MAEVALAVEVKAEAQPLVARAVADPDAVIKIVMEDEGSTEGALEGCFRVVLTFFAYVCLLIPLFWCGAIKVFAQYERIVHFRLGKVQGKKAKGPGIFIMLPFIDEYRKVDVRVKTINVPPQDMMTMDSVTVKVNAIVFYYIADPVKAILGVENFSMSTGLLSQTTLRAVVGESSMDQLLSDRDRINEKMRAELDAGTHPWGIQIVGVEIKDVSLPEKMRRLMASAAEAERDRRGQIISAEGEKQASAMLLEAADNLNNNPSSMQLRYFQTLNQISQEKNSTIVFPLPMSMLTIADARAAQATAEARIVMNKAAGMK